MKMNTLRNPKLLLPVMCAALLLSGCAAGQTEVADPAGQPPGAEHTSISDWTDPRPSEWTDDYVYFGPVDASDDSLQRVQEADTLVLCASLGFKPYAFYEAGTKNVDGFEHDMALYLAETLGIANLEYKNLDFSALIPAVGAKSCDAVMTGIAIRTDRASAPNVKFTTPYIKLYDQIAVRPDSGITSLEDLAGKKIASTTASTDLQIAEAYVAEQLPGAEVLGFNNTNDCFQAVQVGNVDACWLEAPSMSTAIQDFSDLVIVGDPIPYKPVGSFSKDGTENPYVLGAVGMVTNSDDGALNRALSLAIDKMAADGTQQKILEKWNLWNESQTDLVREDA